MSVNSLPKELLNDDYDENFDDEQWDELRNSIHSWAVERERKFLEDWCKDAKLTEPVAYNYDYQTGFVIYTNHPGIMIGRGGELYNKYKKAAPNRVS